MRTLAIVALVVILVIGLFIPIAALLLAIALGFGLLAYKIVQAWKAHRRTQEEIAERLRHS